MSPTDDVGAPSNKSAEHRPDRVSRKDATTEGRSACDTAKSGERSADNPLDPIDAAARILLARACESSTRLRKDLRAGAVAVVVEVPSAEWVDPIARAWRDFVHGPDDGTSDGNGGTTSLSSMSEDALSAWCEFARDGSSKTHRPEQGNDSV